MIALNPIFQLMKVMHRHTDAALDSAVDHSLEGSIVFLFVCL